MKKMVLKIGDKEIVCVPCPEATLTNFKSLGYEEMFPCGFIGKITAIEDGDVESALVFESAFEHKGQKHDVKIGCTNPLNDWMEIGAKCQVMFDPPSIQLITPAP